MLCVDCLIGSSWGGGRLHTLSRMVQRHLVMAILDRSSAVLAFEGIGKVRKCEKTSSGFVQNDVRNATQYTGNFKYKIIKYPEICMKVITKLKRCI